MNLSKREFLQVLSAAGVAGMALGRHAEADAQQAEAALYDVPRFGNVSLLHMTDCHAQLKPLWFRGTPRPDTSEMTWAVERPGRKMRACLSWDDMP